MCVTQVVTFAGECRRAKGNRGATQDRTGQDSCFNCLLQQFDRTREAASRTFWNRQSVSDGLS